METSKQKAIRETYVKELSKDLLNKSDGLEFYNELKQYIDENGWINANECNGTSGYLMESEMDFNFPYLRLKSLQGIETNNGWIKIESETDLPKIDFITQYWLTNGVSMWIETITLNHKIGREKVTHYQPIIKPQPPIY